MTNTWSPNTCPCCLTFILLININENINQHSCQNYTHPPVTAIGWLWIQKCRKSQQKYSLRINCLCGIINREHCTFNYYLYIACYSLYVSQLHNKLMYIYMHTLPFQENWLLNIYEHVFGVAVMVYLFWRHSKPSVNNMGTAITDMQKDKQPNWKIGRRLK